MVYSSNIGGMSLKQGKDVIQKRVDDQHKRIANLFAWKDINTATLACLIRLNKTQPSIFFQGIDLILAKIRRIAEVLDITLSNCCTAIRRFDLVMRPAGSSSSNLGYHDFMTFNRCLSLTCVQSHKNKTKSRHRIDIRCVEIHEKFSELKKRERRIK